MPRSVEDFCMIKLLGFGRSRNVSLLWDCAVFSLSWNIWVERTSRLFRRQRITAIAPMGEDHYTILPLG